MKDSSAAFAVAFMNHGFAIRYDDDASATETLLHES